MLSVKALGLRVWGSGFEVWELGFKDRELGSARSRHVPVYREPDKTLELLSGKPHNLPQLKTIIGIIGAGRDQKSRIRFLF